MTHSTRLLLIAETIGEFPKLKKIAKRIEEHAEIPSEVTPWSNHDDPILGNIGDPMRDDEFLGKWVITGSWDTKWSISGMYSAAAAISEKWPQLQVIVDEVWDTQDNDSPGQERHEWTAGAQMFKWDLVWARSEVN